ncbi:MAG TPA: oxidoreductase, partial [Cyanobacteria bacterium UBA11162]|nr:oxidoreductase [Cyanobacteria bacterium UBA11162]
LPQNLNDLGLGNITLAQLQKAADIACSPSSDIHRLPFEVMPEQLMAAMVSTTIPLEKSRSPLGLTALINEEQN